MVKAAYRKFCTRYIPFLVLDWLAAGMLVFLLHWAASTSERPPEPQTLNMIYIILFIVSVCVPVIASVLILCGIKRFQRKLNQFDRSIQERMEEDFQQGDHLGSLYFTSPCLIVHQINMGKRQGPDCIPYSDISAITIKTVPSRSGQQLLEINKSTGPSNLVLMPFAITEQELVILNQKVEQFRNNIAYIEQDSEERKTEQNSRTRQTALDAANRSSLPLIGFNFAVLILYCVGVLGILSFPKLLYKLLYNSKKLAYHLIFWSNLLFLIWTAAAVLILIFFSIRSIRRHKPSTTAQEHTITIRAYIFSIFVIGFILFLAIAYSADTNLLDFMAIGFQGLLQ